MDFVEYLGWTTLFSVSLGLPRHVFSVHVPWWPSGLLPLLCVLLLEPVNSLTFFCRSCSVPVFTPAPIESSKQQHPHPPYMGVDPEPCSQVLQWNTHWGECSAAPPKDMSTPWVPGPGSVTLFWTRVLLITLMILQWHLSELSKWALHPMTNNRREKETKERKAM